MQQQLFAKQSGIPVNRHQYSTFRQEALLGSSSPALLEIPQLRLSPGRIPFRLDRVIHEERQPLADAEELATFECRFCVARQMTLHHPHRDVLQSYWGRMGMNHQSDLQGRHLGDDISGDIVNAVRQARNHTVMS